MYRVVRDCILLTFPSLAQLLCHFCPFCSCPSKIGQTVKQHEWSQQNLVPDHRGHPVFNELEPALADDAAEDGAGVDADAHVDRLVAVLVKVLDGGDHGQAHLHAVPRVVRLRLRAP